MKRIIVTGVALTALTLSGCASIVKGSSQSIAITTPPAEGANCVLTSKQGNWSVTSPGAVTVSRSKEDVLVKCTKTGFQDAVATIPSNFEGWTVGNLIFGGLIGLGVDAATGAINQYPNAFQVPMNAILGSPAAEVPSRAPQIVSTAPPTS